MKPGILGVLTIVGLIVGVITHGGLEMPLRAIMMTLFLPILIFEASWQLDVRQMQTAWLPITVLTLPGVALTAGLIALAAHFLAGFTWQAALIVGAILAATDPVAVVAIFRQLKIPRHLATIVESESLLNDAAAVVLLRVVLGGSIALAIFGSLGALILGAGVGYISSFALHPKLPLAVRVVIILLVEYAAYALCDHLGWSGIFCVLAGAIMLSRQVRSYKGSRLYAWVERTSSWLANAVNAILFVLIGAAVNPFGSSLSVWIGACIILVAMIIARMVLAYGLLGLITPLARQWLTVIRFAGVRGALSLTLALSLSNTLIQRTAIIDAVFLCVIVTVLVASLTSERRISALNISSN